MYTQYRSYLQTITSLPTPFKRHPAYTPILEHVSQSLGEEYLARILTDTRLTLSQIVAFCAMNDAVGDPHTATIGSLPAPVSPTSLRYLYHASLILEQAGPGPHRMVEVGGGYGGLALALHFLAPIEEYHIVDIDEAIALQGMVLAHLPSVRVHSASTYGDAVPDGCFLISNYCFSEIESEHRAEYQRRLLPRCPHGFLVWNFGPYLDIGKEVTRRPEVPMTGPGNEFVVF